MPEGLDNSKNSKIMKTIYQKSIIKFDVLKFY